jgi:uncharacterized protein
MAQPRDVETRHLARPVEFRAAADGGVGTLTGYAAVFGAYSQNMGGFVEQVDTGAFTKSLSDGLRVLCRGNHKDSALLGTSDAGTLTVTVDDVGLLYVCDLPDTSPGRDTAVLAKRGDIRYSSFAFICIEDEWSVTEQGFPLRTLLQVRLVDVAPVSNPAYLDSSAGMRSLAARVNVPLDELAARSTEEIRSLLSVGNSPAVSEGISVPVVDEAEAREAAPVADETPEAEQRETHSVDVMRRLLELDALR